MKKALTTPKILLSSVDEVLLDSGNLLKMCFVTCSNSVWLLLFSCLFCSFVVTIYLIFISEGLAKYFFLCLLVQLPLKGVCLK